MNNKKPFNTINLPKSPVKPPEKPVEPEIKLPTSHEPGDTSVFHGREQMRKKEMVRNVRDELLKMSPQEKRKYGIKLTGKKWELDQQAREIVKSMPDVISPGIYDKREANKDIFLQKLKVRDERVYTHKSTIQDTKRLKLLEKLFKGKKL